VAGHSVCGHFPGGRGVYLDLLGIVLVMQLGKDLVAASATPLVLSVLQDGDSYGYEIIQQIRELSDSKLEWKEGMLYPLLHRLEQRGFIEGYDARSESGRKRRYYRISEAGTRELAGRRRDFATVAAMLGMTPRSGFEASHA